jgi:hypothetical protein
MVLRGLSGTLGAVYWKIKWGLAYPSLFSTDGYYERRHERFELIPTRTDSGKRTDNPVVPIRRKAQRVGQPFSWRFK